MAIARQLEARERELRACKQRNKQLTAERDSYKNRCDKAQALVAQLSDMLGPRGE
jgi:hypothetical protein